jgi:hypothetical protein
MAGKAPPHCDVGETSGDKRAMQSHEAAFRSRLGSTGVYKAPGGTGSSKAMPPASSKSDSGRKLGGNSGPRSFTAIKT